MRSQAICSPPLGALAGGALLDALFVLALNQAMHVDTGCVDGVRVQRAERYDFLDFGHAHLAAGGGGGAEVAGGLAEDEVAGRVRLPRLDDGQISDDAAFQDLILPVEIHHRFAVGNHRAPQREQDKESCAAAFNI